MSQISYYQNSFKPVPVKDFELLDFIAGVRDGEWQDEVLNYRNQTNKDDKDKIKRACPAVTIAGTFHPDRKDINLKKHSGRLAIDIDDFDNVEKFKNDPFIEAAFKSISGNGICLIVKIDSKKHEQSYAAFSEYLFNQYDVFTDPTGVNIGRLRFVSWDPDLHYNEKAKVFNQVIDKKILQHKNIDFVFAEDDFKYLIEQIINTHKDITGSYYEWVRIGFGIAEQFGESGLEYFQAISQFSDKYHAEKTEKQYRACLKSRGTTKCTIATVYYYSKQHGLKIYSNKTNDIIRYANNTKNDRSRGIGHIKDVVPGMLEQGIITIEEQESARKIVEQVFSQNIEQENSSLILDVKDFVYQKYHLRKNAVTRNVELNGIPLTDQKVNTIYLDVASCFEKVSKDLVLTIIYSDYTEEYNPIFEFYEANKNVDLDDEIKKLCRTIITDTESFDVFILKWFVGIIASIHGYHSPLALVLTGGINVGKTEWFRRLLPRPLLSLYTEEKLKDDKDAFILMTKKLLIMDDEWGGMSKKEDKFFKALMSKQSFPIREPYGKISVDLNRLAVFCGTTNECEIIADPDTNRRLLPINVIDIDKELYNSIDKTALFIEAWKYYERGYDWRMSSKDIEILAKSSEKHRVTEPEEELLHAYFDKPVDSYFAKKLTNSEILSYLKRISQTNMNSKRLGAALKSGGFEQKSEKRNGKTQRLWLIDYKSNAMAVPT